MPTKALALGALFSALSLLDARAHVSGHGAALEGKGPSGGNLVSVVSADQAEKGAQATTLALGEWFLREGELEVRFWKPGSNAQRKNAEEIVGPGEVKWIVLGAEKPVVLKTASELTSASVRRRFEPSLLAGARAVEVILPSPRANEAKRVLLISLK